MSLHTLLGTVGGITDRIVRNICRMLGGGDWGADLFVLESFGVDLLELILSPSPASN